MPLSEHTTAWKPRLEAFQEQGEQRTATTKPITRKTLPVFAGAAISQPERPARSIGAKKNPGNARERT
jgi:hypothetical protein